MTYTQILALLIATILGGSLFAATHYLRHTDPPKPDPVQDPEGDEKRIQAWFGSGKITCPDCEGELLVGPQGGVSRNCLCEQCHAEFNIYGSLTKRLHPPGQGRTGLYGVT